MKSLFFGILLIIVIGIGGLVYRNAVEHPTQPIACPTTEFICPDGTKVTHIGNSCEFPVCPSPNVTLASAGISFALPEGYSATTLRDEASIATYTKPASASSTSDASIIIRQYAISASSTALSIIQQTAIGGASGMPVSVTSFTSSMIGGRRFSVATVERFEGVVDTSYYFARGADVLRFDAIDMNVANWTDSNLDISALPAHKALIKLLVTLQGQ